MSQSWATMIVLVLLVFSRVLAAERHAPPRTSNVVPQKLKTDAYPQVVSITYPGLDGLRGKVNGKPKKWRGCTGTVFSHGKNSCVLTAGHCMGGMLGPNHYKPRASDEVLKGIQFRNSKGQVTKIDASDLTKSVAIHSRETSETDPNLGALENQALDLAVVKLDGPATGFSFDEVVPAQNLDSASIFKKARIVGAGAHAKFDAITLEGNTQWPFPNQFEQNIYAMEQEYVGEASELNKNALSRYVMETNPVSMKPTDAATVEKQLSYNTDKRNKKWKLMTEQERQTMKEQSQDWSKSWTELSEEERKSAVDNAIAENKAFNEGYPQYLDAFSNKLKNKKYGVAFLQATPHEIGFGDSGAPLFLRDKANRERLHGIAVSGDDREWKYAGVVSLTNPPQRKWITEQLMAMGCMPRTGT